MYLFMYKFSIDKEYIEYLKKHEIDEKKKKLPPKWQLRPGQEKKGKQQNLTHDDAHDIYCVRFSVKCASR